ncbi:unnamed protein product [Phyllotreta striolata]|uniref:Uncharacterized protein n=1 Tax=Phyllotreta striolata TaxID=444603 RepID=A0A9N9TWY6_PHYSR|nr:unnamed protein product [Phyllotreta striolata]
MNNRPPSIPFSVIRELRCGNCRNAISCAPVIVLSHEVVLCGRCHKVTKNGYRNHAFEALASIFLYPCRYWSNHCPRILQWNECFDHEERCSYSSGCGLFFKHPKAFVKGARDMPFDDVRLIPVPETLFDQIKCVQCESYLSCEPVHIRPDGRNLCHRCYSSNGAPGECLRNVAYEMVSNILVFPCVYRNRGCPTRLKFGRDLWHHESECSYNQMYRKPERNASKKERGVIQTHSGHYYGTITPYSAPFAPPSTNSEFDINKELVKSLKKQQERKMMKAEEINSAILDNSSVENKSSSSEYSTRSDEPQTPRSAYSDNFAYTNGVRDDPEADSGGGEPPPASRRGSNDGERHLSRANSYIYEPVLYKGQKSPLQDLDYNLLAGHYPVFLNPYGQGIIPKPSFRSAVRTDSFLNNKELINELRLKQQLKARSAEKRDADNSPYKECNNLEEILQAHNNIG